MKTLLIAGMLVLAAAPSYAQQHADVYARFAGGFATSPDGTSGDVLGEVGVRVAPHLSVFGDIGQFHNLQPSQAQPAVDAVDCDARRRRALGDGGRTRAGLVFDGRPALDDAGESARVAVRVRRRRFREDDAERHVHLLERHARRRAHAADLG